MRIGYLQEHYPYKRCVKSNTTQQFILLKNNRYGKLYQRITSIIRKIGIIFRKKSLEWDLLCVTKESYFGNVGDVDIIHTFNVLMKTQKPWVCTFESKTPTTYETFSRCWEVDSSVHIHSKRTLQMLRLCAKDNCLGMIAISQSAYQIQKELILRSVLDDQLKAKILQKTRLILPPQEPIISYSDIDKKFKNIDTISFVFIGHEFFRKGGAQVVNCLEHFANDGYNIQLNIVSKLTVGDYATDSTVEDAEFIRKRLGELEWVNYYPELNNEQVLELAQRTHIGLLPSITETFGFSVLELQACGCPCITTNIRALGEINNDEVGWICDLQPNEFGEVIYPFDIHSKKVKVQENLENNLIHIIQKILVNPQEILPKARNAYRRVVKDYNTSSFEEKINEIYIKSIDIGV